ncbi:MAG TPA: hypothetical protein VHZ31_00110 [Solirubrobacteraceae bacterium]|jgi:hypothetical protein|nr:hypothetical protein [Solirubrobacteraceae bacterium]
MTDRSTPSHELACLSQLRAELQQAEQLQRERGVRPLTRVRRHARRLLHPAPAALALALAGSGVAAATGIVPAAWQPHFGSPGSAEQQPTVTAGKPPARQLATIGILRRSQTPADRDAATLALRYFGTSTQGVRTDYIHSLDLADGHKAVLVPATTWHARIPNTGDLSKRDVVCLFIADDNGDGGVKGCYTTAEVLDATAHLALGTTFYSLLPDGVTRVEADFGDGRVVGAAVADNVAAVIAPTGMAPWPMTITWLAADGSTVKTSVLGRTPLPVPPSSPGGS